MQYIRTYASEEYKENILTLTKRLTDIPAFLFAIIISMIVLATDFGLKDSYVGQMHAVLADRAPSEVVIDLTHYLPQYDVQSAAYYLSAYTREFPKGSIFVCVVDPGVGSDRRPIMMLADGYWYVGPDNGIFTMIARHASKLQAWEITWRPEQLSSSFHGRDLFAPVAAMLAYCEIPDSKAINLASYNESEWPDDLYKIIYIDHFGNLITGIRASTISDVDVLNIVGVSIPHVRVFSAVEVGELYWYENANGLIEIAANLASAASILNISIGDVVKKYDNN